MSGLNKVMLIGNLGADPEMKFTANGNAVTNFRIAISREWNADGEKKSQTEWVPIVTWNKTAELCGQHLTKGRKVYVEGRLQTRSWDAPDGSKRYRTEVVADAVMFLDKAGVGLHEATNEGEIEPDDLPFE